MEQFTGFWQILIITTLSFWSLFAIGALIYVICSSCEMPAEEMCQTSDDVEETEIEARRQLPNNEVVYYEERNERSREMIYV